MFLKKIRLNDEKTLFYERNAYFINFISSDTKLINDTEHVYICDDDFAINVLENKFHINMYEDKPKILIRTILVEAFPEELYNMITLSKNIVYSFMMYLNDDKLDKLCKE